MEHHFIAQKDLCWGFPLLLRAGLMSGLIALRSISSSVYGLASFVVNIETTNIYKTPRVESEEDLTMLRTKYNYVML